MSLTSSYGMYKTKYDNSLNIIQPIAQGGQMNFVSTITCSSDGKHVTYAHWIGDRSNYSNTYGKTWRFTPNTAGSDKANTGYTPYTRNFQNAWVSSIVCSRDGRYLVQGIQRYTKITIGILNEFDTPDYGIVYSHDYGQNWYYSTTVFIHGVYSLTASSSCKYIIAGTSKTTVRSEDYGVTWNSVGLSLKSPSLSLSGKYAVAADASGTIIYISSNYGAMHSWSNISSLNLTTYGFDTSQNISSVKISGDGKKIIALINPRADNTNGGMLISHDFGTNWNKLTNAPSSNYAWQKIVSSENFQYLFASSNAIDAGSTLIGHDACIYISSNFGNTWTILGDSQVDGILDKGVWSQNFWALCTTSSGQYMLSVNYYGSNICNYVANNYTYSYTPIKIAYNNMFNFTFTSILYDCSGTYFLRNEKDETLSTKIITDTTVNSITFTDISTNSFDYGMSNLFVYKQNENEPNSGFDIQISDPMVINATCFLEGTKILAMDKKRIMKYIPIEKLKPGMLVKTLYAGFVPIKYIGYSTIYNPGLATRVRDQLFKCTKSAYPELIEDLVLTGNHSVLVDTITDEERQQITETLGGIYVTDRKYRLPAFDDKRAVPYEQRGDFCIWNLALENEDYYANYGIYANGLLVETTSCRYIKEISRMTLIE